jgi:hypothetical protein
MNAFYISLLTMTSSIAFGTVYNSFRESIKVKKNANIYLTLLYQVLQCRSSVGGAIFLMEPEPYRDVAPAPMLKMALFVK